MKNKGLDTTREKSFSFFFSVKISVEFSAIVSSFLSLHGFSLEEYYANAKGCSVSKTPFSPVQKPEEGLSHLTEWSSSHAISVKLTYVLQNSFKITFLMNFGAKKELTQ